MYSSCPGIWSKAEMSVWKFFAKISFGTCAIQSVSWHISWHAVLYAHIIDPELTRKVESSLKSPSGNTSKNSEPSGFCEVACRECGTPGGKYQRSPGPFEG
jgi:hypothetical protein